MSATRACCAVGIHYYRNPQLLPNVDALQKNVDLTQQLGLVHARLDVRSHADLSMMPPSG